MNKQLGKNLENALYRLVARADANGLTSTGNYTAPEFQELKKRGYFDSCREFLNYSAQVRLSQKALGYFG